MMLDDRTRCSVDSISLKSPRRLNLIIVASPHMFTLVSWVDVGGRCYNVPERLSEGARHIESG